MTRQAPALIQSRHAALRMVRQNYPQARLVLTDEPDAEDDEIDLGGDCGIQIEQTSVGLAFCATFVHRDAEGELEAVTHGTPTPHVLIAAQEAITIAAKSRHQGKATTHAGLTDEYQAWTAEQGLPGLSADELIFEDLTDAQRRYVSDFILRWEAAADKEG